MFKEIKKRKISATEVNIAQKDNKIKKDNLRKKRETQKIYTNNNKLNIQSKTSKKDFEAKLSRINLKNIIKKIDLFSISLSKKSNKRNVIKNKIEKIKNNDKLFTNFISLKSNRNKGPNIEKYNKNTKNNSKEKTNKYLYIDSLTASDDRYNKKDFLVKYKQNKKKDNKKKERCIHSYSSNNNLFNMINSDISNIKHTSNNHNPKNKNHFIKFRRNKTEIGRLDIGPKNDIKKRRLHISFDKNIKKRNSFSKKKNILLNDYNESSTINLKKNNNKKIILNEQLKKFIVKGKSENKNQTDIKKKGLYLVTQGSKKKTKHNYSKENLKKNIPKPITPHINIKIKKHNKENSKYQFDSQTLNTFDNYFINTSSSNFKEDESKSIKTSINYNIINKNIYNEIEKEENYLINNALINIRGISIPGKDSKNQIKLNQDSYIIKRDVNKIKNFNIFGVFDGHGFYGHKISSYLKETIIKTIEEKVEIISNNLEIIYKEFKKDNYLVIKNIFNEIDNQIINKNEIDVNLSGSTCNLIIQLGDHIICANTGDSRAILIFEEKNNNIKEEDIIKNNKIFPLSIDCKPSLPKEKERILKKGGILSRLKNSEHKEFGPLRVFLKGSLLPGLSMSRSFGDKLCKGIGIIVDPLIKEYNLNKDVKYILIASDGIWEYLSNEQIMSIGNKYYEMNDPDNFCQDLIKISTELWEKNSRNIDDITLIVIFFTFL